MSKTPSIAELLRMGARDWNELRKAGKVARDHTGATLDEVFSAGADFSELTLVGTEWQKCELAKVNFRDADLSNAYFVGGRLEECVFHGANLDGATFESVKLVRCDFTGARGLDNLELDEVETKDVVGLEPEDDEEESAAPAPVLASVRSVGGDVSALEEIVEWASARASVSTGTGASEAELRALESTLGASFPADFRAFLTRFGRLEVQGSRRWLVGGVADLEALRAKFRSECDRWAGDPGWLTPAGSTAPSAAVKARRAELREELGLTDAHVQPVVGDAKDTMRIAYQHLVPVMGDPDELAHAVDCIGPGGRIYVVAIEEGDVRPAHHGFTAWLTRRLKSALADD